MGAPQGNQNAAKAKIWSSAITRALDKKSAIDRKDAIDELALVLIDKCLEGDLGALKELGDRLEGKPAQALVHQGDEDNPVAFREVKRTIVAANQNTDDTDG